MPRYKGIGMPKSKKKAVAQPSEAQEESSAPPAPSEPPAPPSPDSKQVDRKRPAQSPGMSAVKQATTSVLGPAFDWAEHQPNISLKEKVGRG